MSTHSPDEIRAQLAKMLASKAFASAERIRRFLEFTVEHTIGSPDYPLKEIIIGNELYATNGEFDPRLSAVVRVDANRLRTKLREYYDSEGAGDSLQIDLPKGTYTPVFRSSGSEAAHDAISIPDRADPSIAVLPFSTSAPNLAITSATV